EGVTELGEVGTECAPPMPHVELAGVPLDHVDGGVALLGVVVVAGGQVDLDRSHEGVAERIVPQGCALDHRLLEAAPVGASPGSTDRRGSPLAGLWIGHLASPD